MAYGVSKTAVLGCFLFNVLDTENWILITPMYPSETHPFGPIFRENLPTDRPEVLPKYEAWATNLGNHIFIFVCRELNQGGQDA